MKCSFTLMALLFAISVAGCAVQQPYVVAPQITDKTTDQTSGTNADRTANSGSAVVAAPQGTNAVPGTARSLPYKGRLIEGDPTELPPAIAKALSNDAPLTFKYREELTHDEYHIPMIISALDPVTYAGSPLGDYGATAFATLTIYDGTKVVGDYTAKAHVSKAYNLYSEPKHSELDRAARDAVRVRIEQKLYADAPRVAHAAGIPSPSVPE
jgi:hypothetical protein